MPIVDGTTYHEQADPAVIRVLERARLSHRRMRLRVYYGDPATGRPWGDKLCGYVGRSTGRIKIPLLCPLRTSRYGEGLLEHRIIRIEYSNRKQGGVLYQCAEPHQGEA